MSGLGRAYLIRADVRGTLPLADGSVQCVVTSPPYYGLRDYGDPRQIGLEPTPGEYVSRMVAVFREVRRVLRDDGVCWLNLGDSYNAYNGNRGESPSISGNNGHKHPEHDRGLVSDSLKPKDLLGIPWRVAFALQEDGWYLRSDCIWAKPNPMPESVTDRPTKSHEYVFLLTKSPRYFYDAEAERVPGEPYRVKQPDGWDTGEGSHGSFHRNGREKGAMTDEIRSGANLRTVWTLSTRSYPGAHFACVDDQTECLTTTGWKRHNQLQAGDVAAQYDVVRQCLSWGPVESVATYEVEDQEMVSVDHRDLSMVLTPNHRTIISRRDSKGGGYFPPTVIRADQLKPGHRIPVSAAWDDMPCNAGIGEDWAELLGWYVAEGHENREGWGVDIYQSHDANPVKTERIRSLLKSVGAEFREATANRVWNDRPASMTVFNVIGYAAIRLRQLAPAKVLDWGYLGLPEVDLKALLRGLIEGDGHTRPEDGRRSFVQNSAALCDLVQAIACRLGLATKMSQRANMASHQVFFTEKRFISLRGTNGIGGGPEPSRYSGIVWCPKLPLGTWVARRNGRVFITGNTFPPELPARCIRLGTSEKGACPACGAPWRRVLAKDRQQTRPGLASKVYAEPPVHPDSPVRSHAGIVCGNRDPARHVTTSATVGWEPSCSCDAGEPVPCVVLDVFSGSGTTAAVARELGRVGIGTEVNPEYLELARARVGRKALGRDNPALAAPSSRLSPMPGQRSLFDAAT